MIPKGKGEEVKPQVDLFDAKFLQGDKIKVKENDKSASSIAWPRISITKGFPNNRIKLFFVIIFIKILEKLFFFVFHVAALSSFTYHNSLISLFAHRHITILIHLSYLAIISFSFSSSLIILFELNSDFHLNFFKIITI